jgi:hypothetical protein
VAWLSSGTGFFVDNPFHPFSLAVLGYIFGLSKASPVRAIIRITFWEYQWLCFCLWGLVILQGRPPALMLGFVE